MARPKGTPKTGGRKAGTPNKSTTELKEMILGALDKSGGQEYLEKQATENPNAFMTLLGKVLPTQVDMDAKVCSTISSEPMSADDWTKRYTQNQVIEGQAEKTH